VEVTEKEKTKTPQSAWKMQREVQDANSDPCRLRHPRRCNSSLHPLKTDVSSSTISKGGKFTDAVRIAQAAGYELHDAGQLQTANRLYGFYIDLPNDEGLLVCHDPQTNWINLLQSIESWSGPRSKRIYHDIQSFTLPPAPRSARPGTSS
jgi:hypothetical protein